MLNKIVITITLSVLWTVFSPYRYDFDATWLPAILVAWALYNYISKQWTLLHLQQRIDEL